MRMVRAAGIVWIIALALTPLAWGQEWTRFRGPNGTGLSNAKGIPATWTEKDYQWKVELPAPGHSSPVIWGDKIFLSGAENATAERKIFALSVKDGKNLWTKSYPSVVHRKHGLNSFASPTAVVDADQVYFSWSKPEELTLLAVAHDGTEKWKRNLGPFVSQHSAGVSPILYENLVVLVNCQDKDNMGQMGQSSVVAVDRKTGDTVWQLPCESSLVPYSTPCFRKNAAGQDEMIVNGSSYGIKALNPKTGKVNWEIPQLIDKRSVSSPVITAGGLITITCGSGAGGNFLVAIHPKDATGPLAGTVAYKLDKVAPYVPTPIAKGDRLFLMSDKGVALCVNAKTGEEIWNERVGGTFYGSLVCIGDKLYCPTADGEIVVLSATDKFEELGRNPLGETMHSTPAVAGGRLYLRTVKHLISIGGDKPKLALR